MKNEEIYLEIAGFVIKISFLFSKDSLGFERGFIAKVKDYYRGFLTEDTNGVDYSIEVVYENNFKVIIGKGEDLYINLYKQVSLRKIVTFYHLSGSQFQVVIRRITHKLLVRNSGFILHAAASRVNNNKAILFLGESGAGKSTTMKILSSRFPPLGDDSIIIRKEGRNYYCYSSSAQERNAWFVKNYKKTNLGAICFIKKSLESKLTKITDKQVVMSLLTRQLFSEKEDVSEQMENVIFFVEKFNKFYNLGVSIKDKAELIEVISKYESSKI